jgi:outer membrane protein OmpA-like peptidoglycan-associated protein
MQRANEFYEHFSYQKAITLYQKALIYKEGHEPKLQIANCYRKLNDSEKSLDWYQKTLEHGSLSDEDMLHYGQVLSASQNYDSAYAVLSKFQHIEEWVRARSEGFKNIDKFFYNESAFTIQEALFNSEEADFSPAFSEEGIIFVTSRPFVGMLKSKYNSDNTYFLNLFEVSDGNQPVQLKRRVNTRFHEGPSVLYANFSKMVFTRNNYNKHTHGESERGVTHLKLYLTEKDEKGNWVKAVEFTYNDDQYSIGHPALTTDGSTLYLASDMPGGFGGVDIYRCFWENGRWSEPENLGDAINTARDEMFPYVSDDGFLYFSSDGHEGMGGLDIFRVHLSRSNSKPRNMGFSLNSQKDDFGIILNKEGNKGYFSSNREGGTGDDDIYELVIFDYIIKVNLRDDETKELISGTLQAEDTYLKEIIKDESPVSQIQFPAIRGDVFMIDGLAPEYIPDSLLIETGEESRDFRHLEFDVFLKKPITNRAIVYRVMINNLWKQVMYNMDSTLNIYDGTYEALIQQFINDRVVVDSVITLKNVLFDFDEHIIREDAEITLDHWVAFLNQYPNEKVSLGSHTDVRGSNKYNERLGKRRIKATLKYLLDAGISKDRFMESSYGEEKLFDDCDNDCEDEVRHQNNRRTEILVIRNN